jgi:hypothetical protein
MKVDIQANANLEQALSTLELLGSGILPATQRAVDIGAGFVLKTWVNLAQGNDLSGKPDNVSFKGNIDYANSIRINSISGFHKQVVSDSDIGADLEKGRPEYDMKPALVNGPKSRQAQDGHRYNIVPLRHKVKELMKISVGGDNAYMLAKQIIQQHSTGFKVDSEGKRRLAYAKWNSMKTMGKSTNRNLAGMVRMRTQSVGAKKTSSTYLTFRNVSLSQTGKWIKKAQDPWKITEEVMKQTQGKVENLIHMAIKRDLGVD